MERTYNMKLIFNDTGRHYYIGKEGIREQENPQVLGSRHNPVSFAKYINLIENALADHGWDIQQEAYCMDKDGQELFGSFVVQHVDSTPVHADARQTTFAPTVVFVGSHNQRLPRRLSVGTYTFVCTNKALIADLLNIKTKQTTNIEERLEELVFSGISTLNNKWQSIQHRFTHLDAIYLADLSAHDIMIEMARQGVVSYRVLPDVVREWHTPTAPVGTHNSAFALYNAVTAAINSTRSPRTGFDTAKKVDRFFSRRFDLDSI